MKRNLLYPITLLVCCIAAGCAKKTEVVNYQLTVPVGNFSGTFTRLHLTVKTGKIDTLSASIYLNLNSSGNYAVTGDTTKVHAGSFGTYGLGYGDNLTFTDKTLPPNGTPAKEHLNGNYQYSYGSGALQLLKNVGDSLSYQYNLTTN